MIRPVLKMGEELLLEKAMPVKAFGTPELRRLRAHAGFREPCSSIPLSNPSAKRR